MHELRNEIRKQARKELEVAEFGTSTVKLRLDMTEADKVFDGIERRVDKIEQRLEQLAEKAERVAGAIQADEKTAA